MKDIINLNSTIYIYIYIYKKKKLRNLEKRNNML